MFSRVAVLPCFLLLLFLLSPYPKPLRRDAQQVGAIVRARSGAEICCVPAGGRICGSRVQLVYLPHLAQWALFISAHEAPPFRSQISRSWAACRARVHVRTYRAVHAPLMFPCFVLIVRLPVTVYVCVPCFRLLPCSLPKSDSVYHS